MKKNKNNRIIKDSVLIIDDEEIIREILTEVMDMMSMPVVCASSGEQAIEIFESNQSRIKMILLDMVMPGLSGLETYQKLQSINPDIPIIFMSGYPDRGSTKMAQIPSDLNFLPKPFSVQEVISKVEKVTA